MSQKESLLTSFEKARFQDIVNKPDKTEDEQFLCELIYWISYPSQLSYLNGEASKISHSDGPSRKTLLEIH